MFDSTKAMFEKLMAEDKLDSTSIKNIIENLRVSMERSTHPDLTFAYAEKLADWNELLFVMTADRKQLINGLMSDTKLTVGEEEALRKGGKIQCIKLVRERTNLGLKEAKDLADAAADIMRADGRLAQPVPPIGHQGAVQAQKDFMSVQPPQEDPDEDLPF